MLKFLSIASLFLLLLSISSCKKQVIRDKSQIEDQINFREIEYKNDIKQERDFFSPVSEDQAKRFADNQSENSIFHSQDVNQNLYDVSVDLKDFFKENFSEFVRQKEAKLSDIPIPLNSKPIKEYFDSSLQQEQNNIILGYINSTDLDNIVIFYNKEMERLGWQNVAFFSGFETLMIFKKPFRFCSISIRSSLSILNSNIKALINENSCACTKTQEFCKIVIHVQI